MIAYILRRLLLIIPTLIGILSINFFIIQAAPGGPVEQMLYKLEEENISSTSRFSGMGSSELAGQSSSLSKNSESRYRGARGLDEDMLARIKEIYGFDKPMYKRYFEMLYNFLIFDFGESFFRSVSVLELIAEKLPVSISLGLWSTLIIYLVSIPLGILKALKHGSSFDIWSSAFIVFANAVPVFLFAILMIVLFAGGAFWQIFPLRGLVSSGFADFTLWEKILDYAWHLFLPVLSLSIGGFATLTLLSKNAFLDEIHKQYLTSARAKGLSEFRLLFFHVFRNAMLIVIAGFPATFISMFFTGSLLIEVIFSLDGLGLLGFEATMNRDYPIMFGTLYIFTLLGLLLNLISDISYHLVDPRIDFESRAV